MICRGKEMNANWFWIKFHFQKMIILEHIHITEKKVMTLPRDQANQDFSNDTPQPIMGFLLFILEDK